MLTTRKVVYRLYPTISQQKALLDTLGAHQRLYNAALGQRKDAWRLQRKSLSFVDQCRDLTELRAAAETYTAINAQSAQATLARLHLAFGSFFRRVKAGQTPGFPRFKCFDRFSGWGYKTHGDGFRFIAGDGTHHGKLRLAGIGVVRVRGRARTAGDVKTCEIQHKNGRWYASLSILCTPKRSSADGAVAFDWGVQTFSTNAHVDGSFERIENPRFSAKHAASVTRAAQRLDAVTVKDTIGRPLNAKDPLRIAAKRALGRAKAREANGRHNFLHQTSAALVAANTLIATEKLRISNLTRSAKGTAKKPGTNVAQKAGLDREILATSPATYLAMVRYKAAEAHSVYIEAPTTKLKPSQRCSNCWELPGKKKALAERQHTCACGAGCALTRDQNSARVVLMWAFMTLYAAVLTANGREPAGNSIQTPWRWVA